MTEIHAFDADGTPSPGAQIAMKAHLAAALPVVSVTDHGAVGDGIAEDHVAVQAAMDALGASGGGTLLFPPGTYYFRSLVDLVSDVQILGYGAKIVKRFASDSPYSAFRGKSGTALGYGSGVNNVSVEGLTFSGNYAEGRSICAFSLHRAANVSIRDCRFIEASGAGHVLDLAGCTDVTIRDCTFRGHQVGDAGQNVASECIQIDQSKRGSVSSMSSGDVCDGTVTRNVTIDGCRFEPIEVAGVTHPAPNPVGNHTSREGAWYENIRFTNNTITDPAEDTTSSASAQAYRGNLHFVGNVRRVVIAGNTWRSTTGATVRCIGIYGISRANPAVSDPDLEEPTQDGYPTYPSGVTISGNTFEGFTGEVTNNSTVYVQYVGTGAHHTGIMRNFDLSGNSFSGRTGSPADVRLLDVDNVRIVGNLLTAEAPSRPTAITMAGKLGRIVIASNIAPENFEKLVSDLSSAEATEVTGNLL